MSPALLIAQADPSPAALKEWLAVAMYLVGIAAAVLGVMVLWKQYKEKPAEPAPIPQPFTVTPHIVYTPQQAHDELAEEFRAHQTRTDERFAAMSKASSDSREKIFNLIRSELSGARGEFKSEIAALSSRITDTLIALGRAEGELRANRARNGNEG